MTLATAHWFTDYVGSGFPAEKAALGGCDLSVSHVGVEFR
jgi:hypothetical protein